MRCREFLGIALWGLCAAAGGAWAADCTQSTTLKMQPLHGQPYDVRTVPVTINGQIKHFQLDTGGVVTQISEHTAEAMHLESQDAGFQVYDVNGNVSRRAARVENFLVGKMAFGRVLLPIATAHNGAIDGLLALDMMSNHDIDLDFSRNTMTYLPSGDCHDRPAEGEHGSLPITRVNNRIAAKVTLDGQQIDALIDTGSTQSIISDKIAKYFFHLPLGGAGDRPIENINGDPSFTGYLHTFTSLSFGGMTIDRPDIVILEDRMSRNGDRTPQIGNRALTNNARITLPKLIIGMNILSKLHLYIAFGENRIYITPAAAPRPQ